MAVAGALFFPGASRCGLCGPRGGGPMGAGVLFLAPAGCLPVMQAKGQGSVLWSGWRIVPQMAGCGRRQVREEKCIFCNKTSHRQCRWSGPPSPCAP